MNTANHRKLRLPRLPSFLALVVAASLSVSCLAQNGGAGAQSVTLDELQAKAASGDARAMYQLGMDYQCGRLVETDLAKALQ